MAVLFRKLCHDRLSDKTMRYFVAKTDPDTYSIDRFAADKRTVWDGVKNPQALRAIAAMKPGDRVFIYHSGGDPAVVGVARVASEPRPDAGNARLTVVDLEFDSRLDPPVTLKRIKEEPSFSNFALVRQGRLSTMEAPPEFAAWIEKHSKYVA
jgi:predicted RNA-binding protein with PUA-like domain